MTKDLSYARSKNQNFLLAFSFVASSTPCSSAPTGPRLEASLHLSYCFKPKFTVSVGGQDPLPPPLPHPPEDPGAREGLGPCSPPLCSCPAWEKERAGGEGRPQPRIPSGSGHRALVRPWTASWGSPDPSLGPSPRHAGSGFQPRSWKKRHSPQTPYGGPD